MPRPPKVAPPSALSIATAEVARLVAANDRLRARCQALENERRALARLAQERNYVAIRAVLLARPRKVQP